MIINRTVPTVLVIASAATPREQFAAEELQRYLEKITGSKLPIVNDQTAVDGQQILIGGPARNRKAAELLDAAAFSAEVPGPEGFLIRSFGDDRILIAGSEDSAERGTVYGVYEFLERYLGCSLAAYSKPGLDAGEWVPRQQEIALHAVEYAVRQADCPLRGGVVQFSDSAGNPDRGLNMPLFEWMLKNRFNYAYFWTDSYEKLKKMGIIEELNRRGLELMVGHHDALDLFLPYDGNACFPEKYYETHPEYFRMEEDGSRYKPVDCYGQMILCSRNDEMLRTLGDNILTWAAENPGVKLVSLGLHDGCAPQCCCELCKPYSKIENYVYFANAVRERVKQVRPDLKIVIGAYVDLWEPPQNVQLSDNVVIMEATWHGELRTGGKPDGSGLIGTGFDTNILEWKKTGAGVFFYDYYMGVYQARQRWMPMADEIQAIGRHFIEKGILGSFTQMECFNHWNNLFNFYTFGRTLYDTDRSMEDNLESFGRIFGGGAEPIKAIIRILEDCLDGQEPIKEAAYYMITHVDKAAVNALFAQAFAQAETATARNNVRLLRMAFRYTDLESQQEGADYNPGGREFQQIKFYPHMTPELLHLTAYDSFWKNDPGYGIAIPVRGEPDIPAYDWQQDPWYCFE